MHLSSSITLRRSFVLGPLSMLASGLLFALVNGLIKALGPSYRVWDVAFYRFFWGMLILLTCFGRKVKLFSGKDSGLLILRGITGSMAFFCLVYAFNLIPLSSVLVIFYSYPAFAALLAPLLFKEHITRGEILCVLMAFCGVSIALDFRFEGAVLGQVVTLLGAASAGLAVSIIRKLRENHGPAVIYLHFCLLGTALSLPAFLAHPKLPATSSEGLILCGIVLISLLAQLLMNVGYRYCKSWEGGLLLTTEVIFTALLGILCFGEQMTLRLALGGAIILGSIAALSACRETEAASTEAP